MSLPLIDSESQLFTRWKKASYRLIDLGGYFCQRIETLGRLDCFLRDEDMRRCRDFKKSEIPNGYALDDFLLMSELWIFGAYEFLRTLDGQLRADPGTLTPDQCDTIAATKHKFERIRMPLAKLEPARRFKESDEMHFGACVLGKYQEKGWCWKINANTYVWRIDLADDLLVLAESLPLPAAWQKIIAEQ